MTFAFTIPLSPKPSNKRRAFVIGGHARVVQDRGVVEHQAQIAACAAQHRPAALLDCPLAVEIVAVMPRPASLCGVSKRTGQPLQSPARRWHDSRPDADNLAKSVLDGLRSWWRDDAQVSSLTPEQAARCDALAQRIAELDPRWHKPGMACATKQGAWRRTSDCWTWDADGSWPGGPAPNDPLAGIDVTIAAGPDWRDLATLGAILLSLGDGDVVVVRGYKVANWIASANVDLDVSGPLAESRPEAILSAKLAQLEEK